MRHLKVLLFDSDPANGSGDSLLSTLDSANPQRRLEARSISVSASDEWKTSQDKVFDGFTPDIIFLVLVPDVRMRIHQIFSALRDKAPGVPVMAIIEQGEFLEMIELLKIGFADFITTPLRAIDIVPRVWRLLEQSPREDRLTQALKEKLGLQQTIGESPAFIEEIKKIPLVAKCDANVLVLGETGTGKELCARAIHYLSPRSERPFVPVNCGAVPVELMENELFGHQRGAFTNAFTSEFGLIHESDGGTLFLDEIDCLPLLAQVKLLRFIQEKEYRPLGSRKTCKANVRIIAAANVDLEQAVKDGKLRQDLYYRLNIVPLTLPPLRERRDDILKLANHFLVRYATEFDREVTTLSAEAGQLLTLYDWPGNIRELQHVIERGVVLCNGKSILATDIILPRTAEAAVGESFREVKNRIVGQFEKTYILKLLQAAEGNITRAAQLAHKNRRAFWQLMRKHQINVQPLK